MKDQRSAQGVLSIRRSRWLRAALVAAAFAALSLSVTPGGMRKKARPQLPSGISQPQIQAAGQTIPQQQVQAAGKTTPAASGIKVFIDPATGRIREPEAWEVEQLNRMQAESSRAPGRTRMGRQAAPAAIFHRSGASGVMLGEDQMNYSVAQLNPDGTLSTDCVTGRQVAANRLKSPAKRPVTAGKEKLDEK